MLMHKIAVHDSLIIANHNHMTDSKRWKLANEMSKAASMVIKILDPPPPPTHPGCNWIFM